MNAKEKWVNETLESLDGIERLQLDDALRTRIMRKMQLPAGRVVSINLSTIVRAVAAIALLVALNIFTVSHFMGVGTSPKPTTNSFSQEYFSYVNQPVSF